MKTAETLPNYVWISFKVWAPNFSRVDNRMFLLGSVSELGSWSLDSALEAESTSQMHIWRVDSVLPVGRHIEWTWLTTRLDKSNPRWETPTKRLLVTDAFSGTVHTIFSDPLGVFIRASSCVELTTYKQVDEGYTVVVTGNSRTIGQWDILKAVEAIESPRNSGYWKAVISFDALTILQFKWAVIKLKDRKKVLVIEKNPHSIYGRHTWIRAVAPWSLPEVVIVDTALKTDVMDIYDGRSDIIVKERKKREKEIQYWLSNSSKKKGKAVPLLGIEKVQVPTNIPRTFVTPRTSDTNLKEILPQGRASTMSLDRPSNLSSVMMEQEKESPIKGQLSRAEKLSMEFSKLYQVDPRVMSRIKGKGSSFTNEVAGIDANTGMTLPTWIRTYFSNDWTEDESYESDRNLIDELEHYENQKCPLVSSSCPTIMENYLKSESDEIYLVARDSVSCESLTTSCQKRHDSLLFQDVEHTTNIICSNKLKQDIRKVESDINMKDSGLGTFSSKEHIDNTDSQTQDVETLVLDYQEQQEMCLEPNLGNHEFDISLTTTAKHSLISSEEVVNNSLQTLCKKVVIEQENTHPDAKKDTNIIIFDQNMGEIFSYQCPTAQSKLDDNATKLQADEAVSDLDTLTRTSSYMDHAVISQLSSETSNPTEEQIINIKTSEMVKGMDVHNTNRMSVYSHSCELGTCTSNYSENTGCPFEHLSYWERTTSNLGPIPSWDNNVHLFHTDSNTNDRLSLSQLEDHADTEYLQWLFDKIETEETASLESEKSPNPLHFDSPLLNFFSKQTFKEETKSLEIGELVNESDLSECEEFFSCNTGLVSYADLDNECIQRKRKIARYMESKWGGETQPKDMKEENLVKRFDCEKADFDLLPLDGSGEGKYMSKEYIHVDQLKMCQSEPCCVLDRRAEARKAELLWAKQCLEN